jgi:hypothetical protein
VRDGGRGGHHQAPLQRCQRAQQEEERGHLTRDGPGHGHVGNRSSHWWNTCQMPRGKSFSFWILRHINEKRERNPGAVTDYGANSVRMKKSGPLMKKNKALCWNLRHLGHFYCTLSFENSNFYCTLSFV